MLNTKMEAALNDQIAAEFSAAYVYLAMSAYCESKGFPGTAHWLKKQSSEELEHAMKIYEHLHDRGGKVSLQAIPQPAVEYGTMAEVFEHVLKHEQKVTRLIHNLYDLAVAEKDHAAIPMLQWFIEEQIEEEKSATDVLTMVQMAGTSNNTMIYIDHKLAKR